MPRLLLHIGHPKTGTTALQSVLSANTKTLLNEASVLYPTQTEPNEYKHSFAIPWLFEVDNAAIRRRSRLSGAPLNEMSKQYWRSLSTEIQQTEHDVSVISGEGFWSAARQASKKQQAFARNSLYEIADDITVIAYLKSPASYFLSKINQKLRNFKSVTLPRGDYLSAAIQSWESMGFNHYSWRIFDRKLLTNQDIVEDFCAHYLPNSLNIASLTRDGIEQTNSSISNEALTILEEVTVAHPVLQEDVYDKRRHKIIEILKQSDKAIGGKNRPSLKESAVIAILNRSSDLNWLKKRDLYFPDIEQELINKEPDELPSSFTCVSDFCNVDTNRLADLRAETSKSIARLFRPAPQFFFWSFQRRN